MDSLQRMYLPVQGSEYAAGVDQIYNFIFVFSIAMTILMTLLLAYFVFKYRASQNNSGPSAKDNHFLEFGLAGVSCVFFVAIAVWGWTIYHPKEIDAPKGAETVYVSGKQWLWEYNYVDGNQTVNDLYVEVGKPVQLVMTSVDVIHSYFLPAFRIKKDVIPGYRTKTWFMPEKEGTYRLYCAEYCGAAHSKMTGWVHVLSKDKFAEWKGGAGSDENLTMEEKGEKLWKMKGCFSCHSIDGTKLVGPSMKASFGRTSIMADGSKVKFDEEYFRESLLNPRAKIVKGYAPSMPPFQGQLDDAQISQLLEYIKTIK